MNIQDKKGFTLTELLITVGIIAILTATVIVVINPVEYLKQARDTKRLAHMGDLRALLSRYQYSGQRVDSMGTSDTLYVSLVDASSSSCASLDLPSLGGSWVYHCVTSESDLRKSDGTGWIPVNLSSLRAGALPIDPLNEVTGGRYYRYAVSGDFFELNTTLESEKYSSGGASDKITTDGGNSSSLFEAGSSLEVID